MPRRPRRPCGHHGCPNLTERYYCEQHQKEHDRQYNRFGRDKTASAKYGMAWRKIRARFLKAYPLCAMCKLRGQIVPATEAHHIKPLSEGGDHDWDNLMPLCHSCHSAITMTANNTKLV